jgi:hypothetical protein
MKGTMALGGMERREFLQKLIAAALALPAGGLLLSGCGGGGDGDPPPQGELPLKLQGMRDGIASVLQQVSGLTSAASADVPAWTTRLNGQLTQVWPLMVAAPPTELRSNVSGEMAGVLAQLDQLGTPLDYSGPAPAITQQRLTEAWDRADALLAAQPAPAGPYATESTWAFFLMLFLIFPTITTASAFTLAEAAAASDSSHEAASLYATLHPGSPISCTPCFMTAAINAMTGVIMLLFMAIGSHAASLPSMLFGRDWLVALMMMTVLLRITAANGS